MTCSVIVFLDIVTTGRDKRPATENSYTVRKTKIIRQHIIFEKERQPLASCTVEGKENLCIYTGFLGNYTEGMGRSSVWAQVRPPTQGPGAHTAGRPVPPVRSRCLLVETGPVTFPPDVVS